MKPLRVFHIVCRKPYPQLGEKLILRDGDCVEGFDYKRADWGTDFSREFEDVEDTRLKMNTFQEEYYPGALVLTNDSMTIKAIIPITQHLVMKNEVQNDK